MAILDIIPETNIKMDDIRDTLIANGGSVTDNLLTFFTSSSGINPWSKKKPVNYTDDFCQDFDPSMTNYVTGWWKGSDGFCGFSIPVHDTYTSAVNATNGGMNGWTYNIPQLKKRLGDFAGYYPGAKPMMRDFSVPNNVSINEGTLLVTAFLHTDLSDTELSFADFPTLGACYFGVYITNGSETIRATATDTIGNGGSIITLDSFDMTTGEWTACPFLSSKQITQSGETPSSAMYYTIPNLDKVSFNVVDTMVAITLNAFRTSEWVDGNIWFGIRYKVTVRSYYTGSVTLNGNYLQIKDKSKDWNDPVSYNEVSINLTDVTVPPGVSTVTHEGFVKITDVNLYNNCRVWVFLEDGNFYQGITPLTQSTDSGNEKK